MKTRQVNNVIDHKGLLYVKIKTELLRPIWPRVVYDDNKTRQDNDVTDHTSVFYIKNDTKLSWPIGSSVVCDEY